MRIGFHTLEVSEGLSLPHHRFDEGLELVDQVDPWIALVRKIMRIGSDRLWEIARKMGPGKSFIKDFHDP